MLVSFGVLQQVWPRHLGPPVYEANALFDLVGFNLDL